jgi:hypothetical protein
MPLLLQKSWKVWIQDDPSEKQTDEVNIPTYNDMMQDHTEEFAPIKLELDLDETHLRKKIWI